MKTRSTHILIITSWDEKEPLISSYVLPNLFLLKKLIGETGRITLVVTSTHVQEWTEKPTEDYHQIVLPYHKFSLSAVRSILKQVNGLRRFSRKEKVTHLHCFAPVAGTTGLLLKTLTALPLIIDSWEPHADAMVETGQWAANSWAFRIQSLSERWQYFRANFLIAASKGMPSFAAKKWGNRKKANILYRPASVDFNQFDPSKFNRSEIRSRMNIQQDNVLACVSKFGGLYLKEEAFVIFDILNDCFKSNLHFIIASPNTKAELETLFTERGLESNQFTIVNAKHNQIPELLSAADFAFNPQYPVPSKQYGTPVKDGEYWAMGLPTLIFSKISDDSDLIKENHAGVVIKSQDIRDIKDACHKMAQAVAVKAFDTNAIRKMALENRSLALAEKAYSAIYKNSRK